MTQNSARSQPDLPHQRIRFGLVFLASTAIVLTGCTARRRPAIPWATAVQIKPVFSARSSNPVDVPEDPLPDLRLEVPDIPPRLIPVRSAPLRPRVSVPSPSAAEVEKPVAPLIAPQLTLEEGVLAQQQTKQSLARAERNLEAARGRRLNAAQLDLVSKITGFLKDAREAAQTADWTRARSLAKKAEVLSEELAGSL